MRILAIETTSAHGSLALLDDEQIIAERQLDARNYSRQLLQEIEGLLGGPPLRLEDVELLAVASGPGSFTGARIGLTVAKGLMEVTGIPAVAVSTLQAVAAAAGRMPVLAVMDASRGEVYFGSYPLGPNAYPLPESGAVAAAEAGEEGLEPLDAFLARLESSPETTVATPHAALAEACAGLGEVQLISPVLAPWVGRVGLHRYRAGQLTDALRLDAHYIRRSDAELYAPPLLRQS